MQSALGPWRELCLTGTGAEWRYQPGSIDRRLKLNTLTQCRKVGVRQPDPGGRIRPKATGGLPSGTTRRTRIPYPKGSVAGNGETCKRGI